MFLKFQPFFLISETPLHPGSGNELGLVDLPIQRERHTNFPKIEGSGLKGSIKEAFENSEKEIVMPNKGKQGEKIKVKDYVSLIFGPESGNEHAAALAFMDAKILFFPVKSLRGIFAWITCPQVIERFKEDMRMIKFNNDIENFKAKEGTIPKDSNLVVSSKIVLEEYTFEVVPDDETTKIAKWFAERVFPLKKPDIYKYWREKLMKDLVILSDDEFKEFVSTSTEVIARTVIDDKRGTAKNLWYEEYLPQDTILYSIAMATAIMEEEQRKGVFADGTPEKEAEKVISYFKEGLHEVIQIGGNKTIGKGITRIQLLEEGRP